MEDWRENVNMNEAQFEAIRECEEMGLGSKPSWTMQVLTAKYYARLEQKWISPNKKPEIEQLIEVLFTDEWGSCRHITIVEFEKGMGNTFRIGDMCRVIAWRYLELPETTENGMMIE